MARKKQSDTEVKKNRVFACMVYPESAPADWLEIVNSYHVPTFVGPLHDKDYVEQEYADGELWLLKKPHYHVMMMWSGPKTDTSVRKIFESFGGVGCEIIEHTVGMARYLCHLDEKSPFKYHYNTSEVQEFGGADYQDLITSVDSDFYRIMCEMVDWCVANNCISYSELLIYARIHEKSWFRVLCNRGTMVMKEFLKSHGWTMNRS